MPGDLLHSSHCVYLQGGADIFPCCRGMSSNPSRFSSVFGRRGSELSELTVIRHTQWVLPPLDQPKHQRNLGRGDAFVSQLNSYSTDVGPLAGEASTGRTVWSKEQFKRSIQSSHDGAVAALRSPGLALVKPES